MKYLLRWTIKKTVCHILRIHLNAQAAATVLDMESQPFKHIR